RRGRRRPRRAGAACAARADVAAGARVVVIAGARVGHVHAGPGGVADVVGTDVPVVRARGPGRLEDATRRAAVAVEVIAVLAILAGVDHAVRALGARDGAAPGTDTRGGVVGAGERLAVTSAADDETGAEPGELPADRECAGDGIHGAARGYRMRPRDGAGAGDLKGRARLREDERARDVDHVFATQVDRRRRRFRAEKQQQRREEQ